VAVFEARAELDFDNFFPMEALAPINVKVKAIIAKSRNFLMVELLSVARIENVFFIRCRRALLGRRHRFPAKVISTFAVPSQALFTCALSTRTDFAANPT
jgi:hypothetical protein